MNRMLRFFAIGWLISGLMTYAETEYQYHHFVFVTPSYNNNGEHKWYEKNLDSMLGQDYENFDIIYVDDNSPDGTGESVEEYKQAHPRGDKITLIRNSERKLALANIYEAIQQCNDRSIVVIVDGDDWLAHNKVLSYLNAVYQNPNIWLTYGQYREYPSKKKGFCVPYPQKIIINNDYRSFLDGPSHLRTFYAGLFKKIKKEDLMLDDEFFKMTYDLAIMFPMLEMTGGRFAFIADVLLEYNSSNPINDHKVNKALQAQIDKHIRSLPKYEPLASLW